MVLSPNVENAHCSRDKSWRITLLQLCMAPACTISDHCVDLAYIPWRVVTPYFRCSWPACVYKFFPHRVLDLGDLGQAYIGMEMLMIQGAPFVHIMVLWLNDRTEMHPVMASIVQCRDNPILECLELTGQATLAPPLVSVAIRGGMFRVPDKFFLSLAQRVAARNSPFNSVVQRGYSTQTMVNLAPLNAR